jgi:hypothetical protein
VRRWSMQSRSQRMHEKRRRGGVLTAPTRG